MLYLIYGIVCIAAVVAQSTTYPVLPSLNGLYDIFLPFLVYLVLSRPFGEPLVFGLACGVVMDSASGGAFGLYTLSYLWSAILIRFAMLFFDKDSIPFQAFSVGLGVLLENWFFWTTEEMAGVTDFGGADMAALLARQLLPALVSGPVLVLLFKGVFKSLEARSDRTG